MASRPPDDTDCPVCGQPYQRRVIVARGDGWGDLYPGSPFAFFQKFRRRCTARRDVEAGTTLSGDKRAVYFHDAGGRSRI